jgi:hypothetical protein
MSSANVEISMTLMMMMMMMMTMMMMMKMMIYSNKPQIKINYKGISKKLNISFLNGIFAANQLPNPTTVVPCFDEASATLTV